MANVCVITADGSGMSLVVAKDKKIVISSKTLESVPPFSVEDRIDKPEELGYAFATIAGETNGYPAGDDVLCGGGSTYGMK